MKFYLFSTVKHELLTLYFFPQVVRLSNIVELARGVNMKVNFELPI